MNGLPVMEIAADRSPLLPIGQGLRQVLDWIFPPCCLGCGRHISHNTKAWWQRPDQQLAGWLCRSCCLKAQPIGSPLCTICGIPFETSFGPDHLCAACIRRRGPLEKVRAVFTYGEPVRRLIHAFKYGRMTGLAKPLGKLMFQTLTRWWDPDGVDLAIPVALHPKKERRRTFNQAWLLLRACQQQAVVNGPALEIANRVLCRQGPTRSQAGLGRQQRRRNVKGVFKVNRTDVVQGKKILLIDDVFTTGATLEACSRSLLQAGAARVDALVLARVI